MIFNAIEKGKLKTETTSLMKELFLHPVTPYQKSQSMCSEY
jgi:hypothetical protein